MSDSQSLNTWLLKVTISSKNERVFIRDSSDLGLKIVFDTWWPSMNVGSKHSIAWKNSRHGPLWRFYLYCGIGETCSPGCIGIVCYQVLRHPSISKIYFSLWKPPGVSERMWSVNLDASISGEYQTLGGHSGWPSE